MTETHYRVGRHLGRTVYRVVDGRDEVIGMMDTPELGAMVVEALNLANRLARAREQRPILSAVQPDVDQPIGCPESWCNP